MIVLYIIWGGVMFFQIWGNFMHQNIQRYQYYGKITTIKRKYESLPAIADTSWLYINCDNDGYEFAP